ncbi:MAG: HAMP domain-containing protein [Desulfobacter sp.]|nr:MAG: HAMP domain-containing protein [Desulfobacter sp.]
MFLSPGTRFSDEPDIIVSRESGKKVFVISVPLRKGGKIVGVLAGAVNVSGFSSFFIHDFELGQEGFAYLAQEDGLVVSVSDPSIPLTWIGIHEFGQTILATGKGSIVFDYIQRQWLSAYETLENKKWIFVVTQSLDEAFLAAQKIGWYTGVIGLVSLVLIGVVVVYFFRKLVYERFDRMLDAIGKVERGDLDVRITGGDENDEIGALSKAFNRMADRLKTTLSSLHGEIQVRKKIEASLARHRDTLEVSVAQRTSELVSLQNYLEDVINSMPSIIVGVTHEMEITQWNLKADAITGISGKRARGSLFQDRFPHLKWMAKEMADAVGDKKVFFKARVARPDDKRPGYEDITLYPLMAKDMKGAVIRIDDVTEQAALEASMIQTEKMFSLGGLAAGMAHEINNPLAGIIQNLQVMKNRISPELPKNRETAEELGLDLNLFENYMEKRGMFRLMDSAVMAGGRAASIVDNMLSFSRQESAHLSEIHLPDLVDQAIELAYNDYSLKKKHDFKNIKIIRNYAAKDLRIKGHPSMLQQVFFNLLKNGAQAMGAPPCPGILSSPFPLTLRTAWRLFMLQIMGRAWIKRSVKGYLNLFIPQRRSGTVQGLVFLSLTLSLLKTTVVPLTWCQTLEKAVLL